MLTDFLVEDIAAAQSRRAFWLKLRMARADYFNDNVEIEHPKPEGFYYYLQLRWGIKLRLDKEGNITDEFDVVNEPQYLLFLMKYGS